jgi:hypothetical protein
MRRTHAGLTACARLIRGTAVAACVIAQIVGIQVLTDGDESSVALEPGAAPVTEDDARAASDGLGELRYAGIGGRDDHASTALMSRRANNWET